MSFEVTWSIKRTSTYMSRNGVFGYIGFKKDGDFFLKSSINKPIYFGHFIITDMQVVLESATDLIDGENQVIMQAVPEVGLLIATKINGELEIAYGAEHLQSGDKYEITSKNWSRARKIRVWAKNTVELRDYVRAILKAGKELVDHVLSKNPELRNEIENVIRAISNLEIKSKSL